MITVSHADVKQKLYLPHPYATEGSGSTISVYDLDERRIVSEMVTLPGAYIAKTTPDGRHIWVFSSIEKRAEIFAVATDELVGSAQIGNTISDAVFDPDGSICYVANGSPTGVGENSVTFVDTETKVATYEIATGKNPVSLEIQKDGSRLYVANMNDNSITIIDPDNFSVVGTMYAGIEPYDLVLSAAGRYLFVANRGIDLGTKGGSGVIILETETGRVVRVVETGNSPTSIGLTPDGGRMVISHYDNSHLENLWIYDLIYDGELAEVNLVDKLTVGKGVEYGSVDPSGKSFVIPDHVDGAVYAVDIGNPGNVSKLIGIKSEKSYFAEFATVDFDKEIILRDEIIESNPTSLEAQKAYFEKAYLQNTAGDRNGVVSTYGEIVSKYPGTSSETRALFLLGDLCYHGQLLANAADYYNRGLISYGDHLSRKPEGSILDGSNLLEAAERLGELSLTLGEEYFVNLYKLYGNISAKQPEFPQLFFTFGVNLKKAGNSKFAGKCFEEVENRLIELMDERLYQEMKFKLDLIRHSDRAIVKAKKTKRTITLDGKLDEWGKAEELSLYQRDHVIVNQLRWLDKSDISGSFYVVFDQYNLYIAGSIIDDKVFKRENGAGDYVGMYLDLREGSGDYLTRDRVIDDGVLSIRVNPPSGDDMRFTVQNEQGIEPLVGGMITLDGYNFELKVPLAYLKGFDPSDDRSIGFGIELFDIDSGLESDPPKIIGWLMPSRSAFGPRFSELFGILEF